MVVGELTFSDSDALSAAERRRIVRVLFAEMELPLSAVCACYDLEHCQEAFFFLYQETEKDLIVRCMNDAQALHLASSSYPARFGERMQYTESGTYPSILGLYRGYLPDGQRIDSSSLLYRAAVREHGEDAASSVFFWLAAQQAGQTGIAVREEHT